MSKNVKVFLVLVTAVALAFAMFSCGGKSKETQAPTSTQSKEQGQKASEPKSAPSPVVAKQQEQQVQTPAQESATSAGKPKIEAVEPVYDFGERLNIEKVEHEFVIKNSGNQLLQISRVSTSCGCTVAQPEKKELAPGESTVVKATLNLTGRTGPVSKTITVFSNDPDNPQLVLEFKGVAKSLITLEPDRLVQFGEFPADQKPEPKTLEVKSAMPELKFNITKVDMGEDSLFDYKLETVEEGKHYKITFSLAKDIPPEQINQNIFKRVVISTDAQLEGKPEASSALKSLMVTIAARPLGPIEITPNPITITVSEGDEGDKTTAQYIRVKGVKDKEFKITEVVPPLPEIAVEINERDKGDFLLKISNIPRDENMNGKKFVIKTTSQYAPEIAVGVKTIKYPSKAKMFTQPDSTKSKEGIAESLKKALEQTKKMQNLPAVPNAPSQNQPSNPPQNPNPSSAPSQ